MSGTNFERSERLEKIMERVQSYLGEIRKLVREYEGNTIPTKLSEKSEFMTHSMSDIQADMKAKERPE